MNNNFNEASPLILRADGEIYANIIFNNNNIIGISGTINDITERKLRERYLKIENEVRKILAESDQIELLVAISNLV